MTDQNLELQQARSAEKLQASLEDEDREVSTERSDIQELPVAEFGEVGVQQDRLAEKLEEIHYELLFFAGDYLKKHNSDLKHVFLDKIHVRFFVNNKSEHYHVPLLLSPFGYSTYKGS